MKIRHIIAGAAITAAGIAGFSGVAAAHGVDAGCQPNGQAIVTATQWPEGSTYTVDGGGPVTFSGGFSLTLDGTTTHKIVVTTAPGDDFPTQKLRTPECAPATTTTTPATTTTVASSLHIYVCRDGVIIDIDYKDRLPTDTDTCAPPVDETTTTVAAPPPCVGICGPADEIPTPPVDNTRCIISNPDTGQGTLYDGTPCQVDVAQPVVEDSTTTTAAAVAVAAATKPTAPAVVTLPETGRQTGPMLAIGALILALGTAAVVVSRRRTAS